MNKLTKVLQINAYYGSGSTGNIVKNIENAGKKNGYEMYAIYWLLPNREDTHVIFLGNREPVSAYTKMFEWVFKGGKLKYNLELTEKIANKIVEINPDIIHLHNLHGDFEYGLLDLEILFNVLKNIQKKVIWTFHDCWPITGRCYHFEYMHCEKWKTGCGKCPQRLFDREGIFYDYSDKNWHTKRRLYDQLESLTIVTVSNWLKDVVSKSMVNQREIITIYNGINTNIFRPSDRKEKNDKYKILCIGWDRRKGYKDYYKLAKLLKHDEEIIVVGKRPLFRKLKRKPSNIVEINPATSKEEMSQIYNAVDLYFNASPAETFGLTTVEAMSCGIPVIGYNNTATTEIIENIGGGSVVLNGSVAEAYREIEKYRNEKKVFNTIYNICQTNYSEEKMSEAYIELYRYVFFSKKEHI